MGQALSTNGGRALAIDFGRAYSFLQSIQVLATGVVMASGVGRAYLFL